MMVWVYIYIIRWIEYMKNYFCRLFKTKNRSISNRMETNSARKNSSG